MARVSKIRRQTTVITVDTAAKADLLVAPMIELSQLEHRKAMILQPIAKYKTQIKNPVSENGKVTNSLIVP